jgi:beta-glucanase (GH16 family)
VTTATGGPPYLFDDEFNGAAGSKPSSSLWGVKTLMDRRNAAVMEGWTSISENGRGDLVITAHRDKSGVWRSGWLTGKVPYIGPHDIIVRAEVPCGTGTLAGPAWEWAYPYGAPWAEDDTVEQLGREPQTYHTTLHTSARRQAGSGHNVGVKLCGGFHTYETKMYAGHADFYFDGSLVEKVTRSRLGGVWPFTTIPMIPNISLMMGGSWAGTPTISGPVSMLVDYLRVRRL